MKTDWDTYRKLLLPFSLLYGLIIWIRNWLFDVKILKSRYYYTPIINVGNIAIGGTGKTPHIEYLISLLNSEYRLSTLSRGYKRKTKGYLVADKNHTYKDIGDEPKQIKSQFDDVMVVVDENRRRGIENLEKLNNSPEVILLDDAFQHRYVKPGLNILLTDYHNPYWNDYILPVGNLRDSSSQVRRADIVIVSKTPETISPINKRIIKKELNLFPYQELFFTTIDYGNLIALDSSDIFTPNPESSILLLTGIAKPQHLEAYLKSKFKEVVLAEFPDHHAFTNKEIKKVTAQFESINNSNKIIVTSLKDAVRLKDSSIFAELSKLPIYYQAIEVGFLNDDDKNEFDKLIFKYVRNAKRDRKVY